MLSDDPVKVIPFPERERDAWYRRRYGISLEQYQAMRQAQDGLCALCQAPRTRKLKLDVDHDHRTGRVRGLLCKSCNNALARLENGSGRTFNASIEWMRRKTLYVGGT